MGPGRIAIGFLTFALTMGACGGSGTNPPDDTTTETTGGTGMQLTSTAFGHEATREAMEEQVLAPFGDPVSQSVPLSYERLVGNLHGGSAG